jgi:hypothetical protein
LKGEDRVVRRSRAAGRFVFNVWRRGVKTDPPGYGCT